MFLIEFTKNKGLPIGGGLVGSHLAPRAATELRLTRVDVSRRHHANAGVRRAGIGQQAQRRHG